MRTVIQTLDLLEVALWVLVLMGVRRLVRRQARPRLLFAASLVAALGFSYLAVLSYFRIPVALTPDAVVIQSLVAHLIVDIGLLGLVVSYGRSLKAPA